MDDPKEDPRYCEFAQCRNCGNYGMIQSGKNHRYYCPECDHSQPSPDPDHEDF